MSPLAIQPLDVLLAKNQLANRVFIDTARFPVLLSTARNEHERNERALSFVWFLVVSILMPSVLELFLSRQAAKRLRILPKGNPLELKFDQLEHHALQKIREKGLSPQELAELGLRKTSDLTDKLVNKIRLWKTSIIFVDLFLMALKGQMLYSLRNKISEWKSGRKGFVGQFNYTNKLYTDKKDEAYNKTKAKRRLLSMISGIGSAIALPAMVIHALYNKKTTGITGWLKKMLPKVNYSDVIFMSKWVLLWQVLFSYEIPKLMASRNKSELREDLLEFSIFNFFYFIGDDLLSGSWAKRLQRKLGDTLNGVSLTKTVKVFGKSHTAAVPFNEIYKQLQALHPNADVKAIRSMPAFKAARQVFWFGLGGTSILLGATTLLNNALTKHLTLKDQSKFNQPIIQRWHQLTQSALLPNAHSINTAS
ncbi:MAG: hypothetical protein QE263_07870 [Vampirovibrionales bacterium]|nr:hypothetical protein [Vampirovibrionales bacterium]